MIGLMSQLSGIKNITSTQTLLLMTIKLLEGSDGYAAISFNHLHLLTRISMVTITGNIRALQEKGLIEIISGSGEPNKYKILVEESVF